MRIARDLAKAANGNLKLMSTARILDSLQHLETELKIIYDDIKIHTVEFGVSKATKIKYSVESLPKEFADIDVLINNAGKAFLGREQVGDIADAMKGLILMFNLLLCLPKQYCPSSRRNVWAR